MSNDFGHESSIIACSTLKNFFNYDFNEPTVNFFQSFRFSLFSCEGFVAIERYISWFYKNCLLVAPQIPGSRVVYFEIRLLLTYSPLTFGPQAQINVTPDLHVCFLPQHTVHGGSEFV